jgi:hypothetical protein
MSYRNNEKCALESKKWNEIDSPNLIIFSWYS